MSFVQFGQWQVRDGAGHRKYVNTRERLRFLAAADRLPPYRRGLCLLLVYTGCRVSEGLSLCPQQLEPESCAITLRTLKRRRLAFRTVPVPHALMELLLSLPPAGDRLWTMHRTIAWRLVADAMAQVEIKGPMACCRGGNRDSIHFPHLRVAARLAGKYILSRFFQTQPLRAARRAVEMRAGERQWSKGL